MNLRFGRGSTSARAGHGLGEGHGESDWSNENGNGESHEALLLASPPPLLPPPMTHAEMMAEMLAARHESAHALEMLAQVIGGFTCGGLGGNGGNQGGARSPEGPYSYQDFLKMHPPTVTLTAEPLDVEHWLRILEQKF